MGCGCRKRNVKTMLVEAAYPPAQSQIVSSFHSYVLQWLLRNIHSNSHSALLYRVQYRSTFLQTVPSLKSYQSCNKQGSIRTDGECQKTHPIRSDILYAEKCPRISPKKSPRGRKFAPSTVPELFSPRTFPLGEKITSHKLYRPSPNVCLPLLLARALAAGCAPRLAQTANHSSPTRAHGNDHGATLWGTRSCSAAQPRAPPICGVWPCQPLVGSPLREAVQSPGAEGADDQGQIAGESSDTRHCKAISGKQCSLHRLPTDPLPAPSPNPTQPSFVGLAAGELRRVLLPFAVKR